MGDRNPMGRMSAWLRDAWRAGGTGGLNWHLHAATSQQRWRGTQEAIDRALARVQPTQRQLLLIGGSAGWMMSTAWLSCFERVEAPVVKKAGDIAELTVTAALAFEPAALRDREYGQGKGRVVHGERRQLASRRAG